MKKKISEAINVHINLGERGQYEHIALTKYAEVEIEFDSPEEMKKKEDQLTDELVDNLIRNMRRIPERLGKTTTAVQEIEEKIEKRIPEWLAGQTEPNLARKKHEGVIAKQVGNKADQETRIAESAVEQGSERKIEPSDDSGSTKDFVEGATEDLFGSDKQDSLTEGSEALSDEDLGLGKDAPSEKTAKKDSPNNKPSSPAIVDEELNFDGEDLF